MDAPRKDDLDKFPDTKRPSGVSSYNADKLDKYDKLEKKKPLGKPGEKPVLTKPGSEDTSRYNSTESSTAPSNNISVMAKGPPVTTTVTSGPVAAATPATTEISTSTSTTNSTPASSTSWVCNHSTSSKLDGLRYIVSHCWNLVPDTLETLIRASSATLKSNLLCQVLGSIMKLWMHATGISL